MKVVMCMFSLSMRYCLKIVKSILSQKLYVLQFVIIIYLSVNFSSMAFAENNIVKTSHELVQQVDQWIFGRGQFDKVVKDPSKKLRMVNYFMNKSLVSGFGAGIYALNIWGYLPEMEVQSFSDGFAHSPVPNVNQNSLSFLYTYGIRYEKFMKIAEYFPRKIFLKKYPDYTYEEVGDENTCIFKRYIFIRKRPYTSLLPLRVKKERFFITLAFIKTNKKKNYTQKKKSYACFIGALLYHQGILNAHSIAVQNPDAFVFTGNSERPSMRLSNMFPLWLVQRPEVKNGMGREEVLNLARTLSPVWLKSLGIK